MQSWQKYIHSDPEVLNGKPCIKGTRLAVDFILSLLAAGWSQKQLFDNYPSLKPQHLKAIFAYASNTLKEGLFYEKDNVA